MARYPSRQHVALSIPAGTVLVLDECRPTQTNYVKGWLSASAPVSLRIQAANPVGAVSEIETGAIVNADALGSGWHDTDTPIEWGAEETDSFLIELCASRVRLLLHNAGESAAVVTVETNLMTGGR